MDYTTISKINKAELMCAEEQSKIFHRHDCIFLVLLFHCQSVTFCVWFFTWLSWNVKRRDSITIHHRATHYNSIVPPAVTFHIQIEWNFSPLYQIPELTYSPWQGDSDTQVFVLSLLVKFIPAKNCGDGDLGTINIPTASQAESCII